MTATAAAGFVHQAAIFGSEAELVDCVVPFLRDGIDAGQPTLLAVEPPEEEVIGDALGDLSGGLILLHVDDRYERPLDTLQRNRERVLDHTDGGTAPIRMVGAIPPSAIRSAWDGWVRYEAVINHLLADLPVRSICPYDRRMTPAPVLADVERTHPHLWAREQGWRANPRYTDPAAFLAERAPREIDPIEHQRPDVVLDQPAPLESRRAVAELAGGTPLDDEEVAGLVLAVGEVVANAIVHGTPAVTLRAWSDHDRLVVAVRDAGGGPADPYAGLLPAGDHLSGGRGLWIANQSCSRVTFTSGTDGFTVHLVAGTPLPPLA